MAVLKEALEQDAAAAASAHPPPGEEAPEEDKAAAERQRRRAVAQQQAQALQQEGLVDQAFDVMMRKLEDEGEASDAEYHAAVSQQAPQESEKEQARAQRAREARRRRRQEAQAEAKALQAQGKGEEAMRVLSNAMQKDTAAAAAARPPSSVEPSPAGSRQSSAVSRQSRPPVAGIDIDPAAAAKPEARAEPKEVFATGYTPAGPRGFAEGPSGGLRGRVGAPPGPQGPRGPAGPVGPRGQPPPGATGRNRPNWLDDAPIQQAPMKPPQKVAPLVTAPPAQPGAPPMQVLIPVIRTAVQKSIQEIHSDLTKELAGLRSEFQNMVGTKCGVNEFLALSSRVDAWSQQRLRPSERNASAGARHKTVESPQADTVESPFVTAMKQRTSLPKASGEKKGHHGHSCHERCKEPTCPAALRMTQSLNRLPALKPLPPLH